MLAQITYYFYAWLQVTDSHAASKVNFAVPTGNFGDILAGYYAKRMGLPVGRLVVCTNENDVLHRFFTEGVYSKRPARLTIAPSMDISVSSNFERYLYHVAGDNARVLADMMYTFERTGEMTVPPALLDAARDEFASHASSESDIVAGMRSLWSSEHYLVCPHTATAVVAVRSLGLPPHNTVCLATAHPAKFEEAISLALASATHPPRPAELQALFSLPTRTTSLPNSLSAVQKFMRKKLSRSGSSIASYAPLIGIATVAIGLIAVFASTRRNR